MKILVLFFSIVLISFPMTSIAQRDCQDHIRDLIGSPHLNDPGIYQNVWNREIIQQRGLELAPVESQSENLFPNINVFLQRASEEEKSVLFGLFGPKKSLGNIGLTKQMASILSADDDLRGIIGRRLENNEPISSVTMSEIIYSIRMSFRKTYSESREAISEIRSLEERLAELLKASGEDRNRQQVDLLVDRIMRLQNSISHFEEKESLFDYYELFDEDVAAYILNDLILVGIIESGIISPRYITNKQRIRYYFSNPFSDFYQRRLTYYLYSEPIDGSYNLDRSIFSLESYRDSEIWNPIFTLMTGGVLVSLGTQGHILKEMVSVGLPSILAISSVLPGSVTQRLVAFFRRAIYQSRFKSIRDKVGVMIRDGKFGFTEESGHGEENDSYDPVEFEVIDPLDPIRISRQILEAPNAEQRAQVVSHMVERIEKEILVSYSALLAQDRDIYPIMKYLRMCNQLNECSPYKSPRRVLRKAQLLLDRHNVILTRKQNVLSPLKASLLQVKSNLEETGDSSESVERITLQLENVELLIRLSQKLLEGYEVVTNLLIHGFRFKENYQEIIDELLAIELLMSNSGLIGDVLNPEWILPQLEELGVSIDEGGFH